MESKRAILVSAIVMACLGTGMGMLVHERPASAAILVYDTENILQAAKTAINTASIATDAQKQVALQILDMASMSSDQLTAFLKAQALKQQTINNENASKTGALTTQRTAQAFWNENFQSVEQVLNGQETVMDAYEANQRAIKALEKTNQDALHGAKTAQTATADLSTTVSNAVSASANASGTKEAVQANTQAMAAAAMGTFLGNNLLSEMVATQAVKYQKENQEEAAAIALQNQVADQARSNVDAMKAALKTSSN